MTSHELARALLEMPDVEVLTYTGDVESALCWLPVVRASAGLAFITLDTE
jgi:hypothetical protein